MLEKQLTPLFYALLSLKWLQKTLAVYREKAEEQLQEMVNSVKSICLGPTAWVIDGIFKHRATNPNVLKQLSHKDFLTTLDAVDAERIGIIGICGFGGMGLNAAAMDTRIKATVAVTMYDMSRVTANGYFDAMDAEARYALRQQLNAQRTRDARSGSIAPSAAGLPEALTGDEPQFVKDYFDYYKTKRGFHPRSINSNGAWNATSALSFLNMPLLAYAGEIRSAVLLVHGEKAHSRYFSEDAFKKLSGNNKKLMIVPRASHTDLYDRVDIIPFDRIEAFFKASL